MWVVHKKNIILACFKEKEWADDWRDVYADGCDIIFLNAIGNLL